MKALIDGDVLIYELGFSSQRLNDSGEVDVSSWEFVKDLVDDRIKFIQASTNSTEEPTIFLTTNDFIQRQLNRVRRLEGEEERDWVPVFRHIVATTRPYKDNRLAEKPFHYKNIITYFLSEYDTVVSEDGLEADDLMCITQCNSEPGTTIICSRDKDLRMCPGYHFSWECGKQPSVGPLLVDEIGELKRTEETKYKDGKKKKVVKWFGTGLKFFCYQMIVGDGVDSIPGLVGRGPVYAYNLLNGLNTEEQLIKAVIREYQISVGEGWKTYFNEQGLLLWMQREYPDGAYTFPYYQRG